MKKVFIPKKYFDSEKQKWVKCNSERENWVDDIGWYDEVHSIKRVSETIICVSWNNDCDNMGRPHITIYKGKYYEQKYA